jgi:hypothetical protein
MFQRSTEHENADDCSLGVIFKGCPGRAGELIQDLLDFRFFSSRYRWATVAAHHEPFSTF